MEEFPHIAPEIVTGRKGQSDIFSFGKIVEQIFLKAKLGPLPNILNRAISVDPDARPNLKEIIKGIL